MRDQEIVDLTEAYMQVCENASQTVDEDFQLWVNELVEEGYDLSEYTWDDMYEIYIEELEQLDEAPKGLPYGPVGKGFKKIPAGKKRNKMMQREKDYTKKAMDYARSEGEASGEDRQKMGRIGDALRNPRLREGVDLFDTILEHLVAEGYADTNEAALVIMANMSEEWRQSILSEDPVQDFRDRERAKENAAGMRGPELSHSTKGTPKPGSATITRQPRSREFSHGGTTPRGREFTNPPS